MSARPGSVLLTLVLVAACDIEFTAVEHPNAGLVSVVSEHEGDALQVKLFADLPGADRPPTLLLDGARVHGISHRPARWRFDTTAVVLAGPPEIHLAIAGHQGLDIIVPLVGRGDDAVWSAAGDLTIPLSRSDVQLAESSWQVQLVDSLGRTLGRTDVLSGRLPDPLVLDGGLVPQQTTEARITTTSSETFDVNDYPLHLLVRSRVAVAIPERGS